MTASASTGTCDGPVSVNHTTFSRRLRRCLCQKAMKEGARSSSVTNRHFPNALGRRRRPSILAHRSRDPRRSAQHARFPAVVTPLLNCHGRSFGLRGSRRTSPLLLHRAINPGLRGRNFPSPSGDVPRRNAPRARQRRRARPCHPWAAPSVLACVPIVWRADGSPHPTPVRAAALEPTSPGRSRAGHWSGFSGRWAGLPLRLLVGAPRL